jgi:CDGSH iron-sulfur domain-containing protein 2
MEAVTTFVTSTLPAALVALPLPKTFAGFMKLTQNEWLQLLPFFVTLLVIVYTANAFLGFGGAAKRANHYQDLDKKKVVHKVSLGGKEKLVLCRCWKSKSFPYCDGSHNAHVNDGSDNAGPLIVSL